MNDTKSNNSGAIAFYIFKSARTYRYKALVHTSEVGVGTFDIHAIFRNSAELLAHNERFTD